MRALLFSVVASLLAVIPSGAGRPRPAEASTRGHATHEHAARLDTETASMLASDPSADPDDGAELLGKPAPRWTFDHWIGKPLALDRLRGKVVLLRWWTEGCHFCAATLPVLERERLAHADDGLVVIGVFHPKPPRAVPDAHILELAHELGFSGPIAVDRHWKTLDRYWLDGHPERNWTSVSFLIDRDGIVRWVHGGGEYHPSDDPRHARCAVQFREFQQALAAALAARPGAALR